MVKYESTRQLSILEFKTPFQTSLRTYNKWVRLSDSAMGSFRQPLYECHG